MTDPDDIEVDDLVTRDQLDDVIEGAVADALEGAGGDDHDHEDPPDHDALFPEDFDPDTDLVDPESARDLADQTFIERMRHLAFDTCETEECARLREQFGLDPTDDPADAVDDPETPESESEAESDESDAGDDEAAESESESEDEGESESETEDVETNVFGEPV